MPDLKRLAALSLLLLPFLSLGIMAQQPATTGQSGSCTMPIFTRIVNEPNLFNDEQEEWLGDVIDQTFRQQFNVIEDPDGYLQKLGERLLAQLPPTKIHYRFFIVDAPEINSFGTAGGRIYIFRRMISFTQNEDELAALLGHEIGHIATHQAAIEFSALMRQLNIFQVTDRQDILNKWNRLADNAAKLHPSTNEKREQEEQVIADRVGLYAMARAGYDPSHAVEFLDRLFQTKGKTGGFWSNFFGRTSTESKRLREAMRNAAPLAKSCIAPLPNDSASNFARWQKAVLESKFAVRKEDVKGVLKKTGLNPQLRGDLYSVRFSPNGSYILAQDESSVFLLGREPLANLFRIDAADSSLAHFSPDSKSIVFYDKEYRVEKWDIATQKRAAIHQITLPIECLQVTLSPSGDMLACMTTEFELQLIDVAKNSVLVSRKKFYHPTEWETFLVDVMLLLGEPARLFQMHFSPDNRYFIVGHGHAVLALDLTTWQEVKLPKKLKELSAGLFTFAAADEVAAVEFQNNQQKIALARFPSGDVIDEFPFSDMGELVPASKGNYLLLLHSGDSPVGVVDLTKKSFAFGYKSTGFDIYDRWFAGEAVGGEVGIFDMSDKKTVSQIHLPDSPLGRPRAVAFSNDGKWLAASGPTRGAIWNVETGERAFYTLGFEGAFFDQERFIAKFPKREKNPPRVFQFNPADKTTKFLYPVETASASGQQILSSARTWQLGELLVTLTLAPESKNKPANRLLLKVFDVRTNAKLWEKNLQKTRPEFYHSRTGKTLTMLVGDYDAIKAEAKEDPSLNTKLQAIEGTQGKKASYVLRVFDSLTGNNLGAVLVDTGNLSFRVEWATAIGDTVLVGDSINRTLVYSLKSGAQIGKIFGSLRAVSNDGRKMLLESATGSADLYDISTLASGAHFTFSSRIVHAAFTGDGNTLMVLTADQTVYQLKTSAVEGTRTAEAK